MANTRSSTKRAKQAVKRQLKNKSVKSATKTALRGVIDAIIAKNKELLKVAYPLAVQALSRAASKGAIPKKRAARKISRLTRRAKTI